MSLWIGLAFVVGCYVGAGIMAALTVAKRADESAKVLPLRGRRIVFPTHPKKSA